MLQKDIHYLKLFTIQNFLNYNKFNFFSKLYINLFIIQKLFTSTISNRTSNVINLNVLKTFKCYNNFI